MRAIARRELRNDNTTVIDAVTAGETFVVTRDGEPVAELRPLRAGRRRYTSRVEPAVLTGANVRIDRDRFRTGPADLLIAATAHANGLDLYTGNGQDFAGLETLVRVVDI